MENVVYHEQIVSDVLPQSPADRAGVARGDALLSINGEPVYDLIDYEYLTANARLNLRLRDARGKERTARVKKDEYEPLGLSFATSMMSPMRTCKNRCVFCFIDQMPCGVRTSLSVKDDDWRMSFVMGNYVSLTNVDDAELARMIARRVSPLYISLHASDPALRVKMMANPRAGRVMEQLCALKDAGLQFHLQVVLCPGINDGAALERTLRDAASLFPAARSIAVVPVGLTRFRERLAPLRCFTGEEARALIAAMTSAQAGYLAAFGTRFAFLSDEWYLMAGEPLPDYPAYEDFPQIENGVGLLRLYERDMEDALAGRQPRSVPRAFDMAGGTAAAPFFRPLMERLGAYGVAVTTHAVVNRFFGETVTVGGLVTGGDLTGQLRGKLSSGTLLIPHEMLREREDVFLDGMTLAEAERALGVRILPVRDGEHLIETVFGEE